MIMPVMVLALFQGASWTRYVRSAVLDVIRLDYVTTARSKGLAERVVILKHVVESLTFVRHEWISARPTCPRRRL